MGLGTKILGFFTGGSKTADDIFDKDKGLLMRAGGFIDGLNYSDQEKAEYKAKLGDQALEFVKESKGENTEKSKARRALAIKWIDMQIYLIWITAITIPLATLFPNPGKEILINMFKLTTSYLVAGGTITVMVYFFGTYGWGTYIKKKESQ